MPGVWKVVCAKSPNLGVMPTLKLSTHVLYVQVRGGGGAAERELCRVRMSGRRCSSAPDHSSVAVHDGLRPRPPDTKVLLRNQAVALPDLR